MTDPLANKIVSLRPATLQDKEKVYQWLAHSNLTSEMLGPPKFPDAPVPTWEEFDNDYQAHYFDDSQPLQGRCFVIEHHGEEIGQINYSEIDVATQSTEIDIWLADRRFTGKGLGTEAIRILCNYLHQTFGCNSIYIAPSKRNANAIKSYKKAGFAETTITPEYFVPDYTDTVVLVRRQ
jgi:RimJ/RimL family protein N-acetyltransferase